jgi:AcrR family transcriptional regulator
VAGRPRGVADADLVRAAVAVIGRVGPEGLTLGAVAREAGVVAGTLVQRFGSKRGLLLAVADHSAGGMDELLVRVRARHPGPLEALAELVVEWAAPLATPESYANHLAFLCVDLTDPEFHERALAVHRRQRAAVRSLLAEAVSAGELRPEAEPEALAGTVLALTSGAGLIWALDREGGLAERLRDAVGTALRPYLSEGRNP